MKIYIVGNFYWPIQDALYGVYEDEKMAVKKFCDEFEKFEMRFEEDIGFDRSKINSINDIQKFMNKKYDLLKDDDKVKELIIFEYEITSKK